MSTPAPLVLWEAARRNSLLVGRIPEGLAIAQGMRKACPVPGLEYDKFMTVLLAPGQSVDPHAHRRHAVLYYPEACDPVIIAGDIIRPEAGSCIWIAPGTIHSVPKVLTERLSLAMLVSDPCQHGFHDWEGDPSETRTCKNCGLKLG